MLLKGVTLVWILGDLKCIGSEKCILLGGGGSGGKKYCEMVISGEFSEEKWLLQITDQMFFQMLI